MLETAVPFLPDSAVSNSPGCGDTVLRAWGAGDATSQHHGVTRDGWLLRKMKKETPQKKRYINGY